MSDTTPQPTKEKIPDHRQCRYLKLDGVRCHKWSPPGEAFCHNHRFNRNPAFTKHHGKIRVPLMEDVSSLQVTTTAAVHALLNRTLDRRDARAILTAVKVATGVLRLDLAEKRWLHQTGQIRPEPVTEFAILGHERVAIEDPLPVFVNTTVPDASGAPSHPGAAGVSTALDKRESAVILSEPSEFVAPAVGRNNQFSRESCHPERMPSSARRVERANGPASLSIPGVPSLAPAVDAREAAAESSPGTPHPVPCTLNSNLDPEDDFLTPETFRPFDEKMRIPLPAPGEPDPLRIDGEEWPCPYRFDYCKGPGPKASCHYCTGQLHWEDIHPNEPDPGAPGPLPTTDLSWLALTGQRDIAAPATNPGAPSLSPAVGDRVGGPSPQPALATGAARLTTSLDKRENTVILSEPSESVAREVARNNQCSRESCHPERTPSIARQVERANGPAFLPNSAGERAEAQPATCNPQPETRTPKLSPLNDDPEFYIPGWAPITEDDDDEPRTNPLPTLVACEEQSPQPVGPVACGPWPVAIEVTNAHQPNQQLPSPMPPGFFIAGSANTSSPARTMSPSPVILWQRSLQSESGRQSVEWGRSFPESCWASSCCAPGARARRRAKTSKSSRRTLRWPPSDRSRT